MPTYVATIIKIKFFPSAASAKMKATNLLNSLRGTPEVVEKGCFWFQKMTNFAPKIYKKRQKNSSCFLQIFSPSKKAAFIRRKTKQPLFADFSDPGSQASSIAGKGSPGPGSPARWPESEKAAFICRFFQAPFFADFGNCHFRRNTPRRLYLQIFFPPDFSEISPKFSVSQTSFPACCGRTNAKSWAGSQTNTFNQSSCPT